MNAPLNRRTLLAGGGLGFTALALAACGAGGPKGPEADGGITKITVGATPKPQGEILQFVIDNLQKDAKLEIKIEPYTDYQIPNQALTDGDIDANYFQHKPFLEQQIDEKGFDLTPFEPIHIEPLGLFADKASSVDEIPDGGEIALPNDPTNRGRGIALLADAGLLTLKDGVEPTEAQTSDIATNPKNLKFTELEAAQIPRTLSDFAAGVVNGNYAIEAGLNPKKDSLKLESAKGNPYANMLVVRTDDKDNAGLKKLDELLHSPEVKKFIQKTYTDGSVLPAF